jgi:hypothetical protein
MRNSIFAGSILAITTFSAYASITNNYQYTLFVTANESAIKIQPVTNDPIVLNPDIDEIKASDPRIKSVIEYVKKDGIGISIIFFNPNNLRYVKKVNELFQANHIFTDLPQLTKTKNLVDFNLVKIYVIKDKSHVNESKPAEPTKANQ